MKINPANMDYGTKILELGISIDSRDYLVTILNNKLHGYRLVGESWSMCFEQDIIQFRDNIDKIIEISNNMIKLLGEIESMGEL